MNELTDSAFRLTQYAVYPEPGNNLPYAVLGLADELFGEYYGEYMNDEQERMKEELLDVFWYVNQVSFELSCLLGSAFERHLDNTNVPYTSLEQAAQAVGVLSGIAKKIIRDGKQSALKKHDNALGALNVIKNFVHTEIEELGMNLPDVIQSLHDKLGDRQERGVLHGDGDHR